MDVEARLRVLFLSTKILKKPKTSIRLSCYTSSGPEDERLSGSVLHELAAEVRVP